MARKSQKSRVVQSRKKKNRAEKRNRSVATVSPAPKAHDVSIAESFLQLDLSDEPISRLPNELLQSILAQLEMQELVHLQVVCKKWQAVICSIGHCTKSLCLTESNYGKYKIAGLKKRSFGHIDLNTFTFIKCKRNIREHSHSQFGKLFPNIKSIAMDLSLSDILSILPQLPLDQLTNMALSDFLYNEITLRNDYDYKVRKILTFINSCALLKRIDIQFLVDFQISIIGPILPRLKLFSSASVEPSLVGYFGPNCSRVSLERFGESVNFYQWHTINHQWLINVTHLDLKFVAELDNVIVYLSEHVVSLKVLRLKANLGTLANTRMTSQMIAHLAKLKHLTELEMDWITFDLPQLDQDRRNLRLVRLASVRIFTLSIFVMFNFTDPEMNNMQSALLASVLSTILPNIEHLNITIGYNNNDTAFRTLQGLESHLDRFTKLQTHSF